MAKGSFRVMADACVGLNAQLVISLGGGLDPERLGKLAGDPLVVPYAPQLEIVKRAAAVITHAGLNTTLESLAEGVPLICVPFGNDQPGVESRVAARGAGVVIPHNKLNVTRLRSVVHGVLREEKYRNAARRIQQSMQQVEALSRAADNIEDAFDIGEARLSRVS